MKITKILALAFLVTGFQSTAVELTLLGNQGVAINSKKDAVIVDALYEHYPTWEGFSYDKPLLDKAMLTAYEDKNLAISATHIHRDHFHPRMTGEFLDASENVVYVGGKQTVESIKEDFINEHRIRERLICLASEQCNASYQLSKTTTLTGVSTIHNHNDYHWVENIAMLVTMDNKQILHLGDALLNSANVATLTAKVKQPDAVILPYWFIMEPALFEQFITELAPKTVVVSHFPKEQLQALKGYFAPVVESLTAKITDLSFNILAPGDSVSL